MLSGDAQLAGGGLRVVQVGGIRGSGRPAARRRAFGDGYVGGEGGRHAENELEWTVYMTEPE